MGIRGIVRMNEIAKYEFFTWIDTLETDKLTEYEKTFLSILIDNFEDVAAVGTASGKRAKFLGEKISELKNKTTKELPKHEIKNVSNNNIERIECLDVEKFRGFDSVQNFVFDKQYTFFHGPNGSGKTSFCEALEYCMLGTIEEATSRSISLDKYITHVGEKKAQKPILKCKYSSGEIKECQPDYSKYRFGFIEKNRIDGFSHISAATSKTQTERMAALFGLSEFQEFVKGFTSKDTFDNDKYIKTNSVVQTEYEKELENLSGLEKQANEIAIELKTDEEELKKLIEALKRDDIKTMDEVVKYYTDPKEGIIIKYTREADDNKWIVLDDNEIEKLTLDIKTLINYYDEIQKSNSDILSDVGAVNFLDLFNAVIKIDAESYTQCPICLTPLENVAINPFEYAKNELSKLKRIEIAKKTVKRSTKEIIENYDHVFKAIIRIKVVEIFTEINYALFENKTIKIEDVESLTSDVLCVFSELKKITEILDKKDKASITNEYNRKAQAHNKQFDEKLEKAQKDYKAIVERNGFVESRRKSYNDLVITINKEKEKLKILKEKADKEKIEIEFNKEMIEAYGSIVALLSSYVAGLPAVMSQNLSEKVMEYYNFINEDDADFELLAKLKLPVTTNEKITVELEDGVSQDALLILSEGHVKILGLSILLAKAIYEHSTFLIFDDIVNSVDDDHRDGVARLLMTHNDFANMQMILTCHGELFVSKLENYVKNRKSMARYMFLPADTLEERGVFIKYQDATIPLKTAREKFQEGHLKDCGAKCRQAVECFVGKLWKEVSKFSSNGISVKMRRLESSPDLKSVVTALYRETKPKALKGAEELNADLKVLIEDQMWTLLNKGTHIDETIPEFDRGEMKKLLELIEKIVKEVEELKIKPVNLSIEN